MLAATMTGALAAAQIAELRAAVAVPGGGPDVKAVSRCRRLWRCRLGRCLGRRSRAVPQHTHANAANATHAHMRTAACRASSALVTDHDEGAGTVSLSYATAPDLTSGAMRRAPL